MGKDLRLGPWILTGSLLLASVFEHCWHTHFFPQKVTLSPMGNGFLWHNETEHVRAHTNPSLLMTIVQLVSWQFHYYGQFLLQFLSYSDHNQLIILYMSLFLPRNCRSNSSTSSKWMDKHKISQAHFSFSWQVLQWHWSNVILSSLCALHILVLPTHLIQLIS